MARFRTRQINRDNSDFQYVETLRRNRSKRQKHRVFFVEGVRLINALLGARWNIQGLYYAHDRTPSDWARRVIDTARAETLFELPSALLAQLSQKEEPSELIAVVHMPKDDLDRIPIDDRLLVVLLDRPASPGNLGTLIRSCEALGAHGVLITGHAADLFEPEVIRATAGSLFALPVVRLPSHREVFSWTDLLRTRLSSLRFVGTSAQAPVDLHEHDFYSPTILCLGNEKWGLSRAYRTACDVLVRIPMSGSPQVATSLNVACAGTVVLYEIQRQRQRSMAAHAE